MLIFGEGRCYRCHQEFEDEDVLIPLLRCRIIEGRAYVGETDVSFNGMYIHYKHLNEVAVLA